MKYIPILNSSLQSLSGGDDFNAYAKSFSDYTLKVGIVVKTYDIDDKNNISNHYPEYDVLAVSQEKDLGTASVLYKKCQVLQGFGGIGDFMEAKLRQPDKDPSSKDSDNDPKEENGSIVLLLCLHGSQDTGIIIGALQHPKRKSNLTKDKAQHLEGEYNGVNWRIDKDGALKVTFKSATDNDGNPQDEGAGGTFLTITKDGSFDVNTGEDSEYIRIDKSNKDVGIKAGNKMGITAEDTIGFNAGNNLNLNAKKDLVIDAGGKAALTTESQFELNAGSQVTITTKQMELSADAQLTLKSKMLTLDGQMVFVGGQGGTPALTNSTQFLGVGNLGAPVIANAIGPFSTKVFIAQ